MSTKINTADLVRCSACGRMFDYLSDDIDVIEDPIGDHVHIGRWLCVACDPRNPAPRPARRRTREPEPAKPAPRPEPAPPKFVQACLFIDPEETL